MIDSARVIRELTDKVIDLTARLYISNGASPDLARVAATYETDAYLAGIGFSAPRAIELGVVQSQDRPMRISGGEFRPLA
jgi:hypothetical protein